MKEYFKRCDKLELDALGALWTASSDKDRNVIENYLWSTPKFIVEGVRVWRRKADMAKDPELSRNVKRIAKTKIEEARKNSKGSQIVERMRRLWKKESVTPVPTFSEWIVNEAEIPIDSRGPSQVVVLLKEGFEGLKKLEQIARRIYEELNIPTWIEERNLEGTRRYALCSSLHCFNEEELKAVEKSIKTTLAEFKEKTEL